MTKTGIRILGFVGMLILILSFSNTAMAQNAPPVVDAGEDQTVYRGESTLLDGSASDPDGNPILFWLWTVESAPAGSSPLISDEGIPDPTFVASEAGDYELSFTASDGGLWSEPDYVTIHVLDFQDPIAVINADVTSGPAPLTVQFDASESTIDPGSGPPIYNWSFGNGEVSTDVAPTATYTSPGVYTVILTLFDSRGEFNTTSISISVTAANNPPSAAPTADPASGPAPLTVQFTANASDPDGDDLTFDWDFGDPGSSDNTSTQANPSHEYAASGAYTAWLTVSDGRGLIDQDSIEINVTEPTTETPQEMIENLIGVVEGYIAADTLTRFQGRRLIRYLNRALTRLNNGNLRLAEARLNQFIRTVNRFVRRGVLTAAEGQVLIDAANEIIEAI